MQNKNDLVRPIYGELINVFRAIPIAEKIDYNKVTVDSDYEERINYLITRIEKVSNEDFQIQRGSDKKLGEVLVSEKFIRLFLYHLI